MRGKKPDELTALDKALIPIQQGLDYVPPDIEASLKNCTLDELHELLRKGCTMASVIMAQKGWILLMIKRQVGHGNFKGHLREIGFDYSYAAKCMKVSFAIGRHPALAHITDTHLLRTIAYLPESRQADIEVEVTRINPLDKKKERHNGISPWLLEQIAADLKNDKPKKPGKGGALPAENTDEQWMEVKELWATAVLALGDVVAAAEKIKTWKPEYVDEALERKMVVKLGEQFDRIVSLLHPVEELRRRGMSED